MVDSVTSSSAAIASTASGSSSGVSDGAITDASLADYDDFLTLLTTQLRNQDPLNPQDSTEFVAQIATFTTVEQQINTNDRLEELIALTSAQNVADLASWVGMDVSAPGLAYSFDGVALSVDPVVDASAERAEMVIRDETQAEIARISYDPATESAVIWDGTRSDGSQAGEGVYFIDFELTRVDDEGAESTETFVSSDFSRVVEARDVDGAQALILENGMIIDADQVNAVRDPASTISTTANEVVNALAS